MFDRKPAGSAWSAVKLGRIDGITAVQFTISGRPVNVPVRDNFFAYEGRLFETIFSFSAVTALEGGE